MPTDPDDAPRVVQAAEHLLLASDVDRLAAELDALVRSGTLTVAETQAVNAVRDLVDLLPLVGDPDDGTLGDRMLRFVARAARAIAECYDAGLTGRIIVRRLR